MIEKVKIEEAIGVPLTHAVIGELPTKKPGASRAVKRGGYITLPNASYSSQSAEHRALWEKFRKGAIIP